MSVAVHKAWEHGTASQVDDFRFPVLKPTNIFLGTNSENFAAIDGNRFRKWLRIIDRDVITLGRP